MPEINTCDYSMWNPARFSRHPCLYLHLHLHLEPLPQLDDSSPHMTVLFTDRCRSGLPPSLETLVVTGEKLLAVTLAPGAPAREPCASAGASVMSGTGVQGDVAAIATRRVRLHAPEVELRSSPAGSVTGAAAGLDLVIHAQEVVLELPPGASMGCHAMLDNSASQRRATAEHLAAWISSSAARSVRFEPRRTTANCAAAVFPDALRVAFKAGKRQGMRVGCVFSSADDMLRFMTPLSAQHRLSCPGGRSSDGAAGGVLIERLL